MSETEALFGVLRQSADPDCAAAIESAVAEAPDHELCRINALAFAEKNKLDEERTIAAFMRAARLGLFELSWNVACGGVLEAGTTQNRKLRRIWLHAMPRTISPLSMKWSK